MPLHIDYYASLNSPWTHLGAARIEAMAGAHGASLRVYPVDFGEIFANSGGRLKASATNEITGSSIEGRRNGQTAVSI